MKVISKLITAFSAIVLVWFAVSFIQVNEHNKLGADPMTPEQEATNAFCIAYNMIFDN